MLTFDLYFLLRCQASDVPSHMSKITFNYSKQAKQISVREKTEKSVHNYVQNCKDHKSDTIQFCHSICFVF